MNNAAKELILACARRSLANGGNGRIREMVPQISDWPRVLRAAQLHGVMPLMYTHLKRTCPELVDEAVTKSLTSLYVRNSQKNMTIAASLLSILTLFAANDIPAVPFKGPVLAEKVYGDLGLRQVGDLDILIKRKDVIKAQHLLMAKGYVPELTLYGRRGIDFIQFENSISYHHPRGGPPVDLHWEMTGRYLLTPICMENVEGRLQHSDFLGCKIAILPDDLMILYLCLHGTSHCWERLEWLCGFVEMVRKLSEKELLEVIALAGEMGCKRMLYLGLWLGHGLLDLALPEKHLDVIEKDSGVVKYGKKVKLIIFNPQENSDVNNAEWRFSPLHIHLRDTYRDRIKYAFYLFTMPTIKEWVKCPLPSWLTPLYRVVRPLRLGVTFLFGRK